MIEEDYETYKKMYFVVFPVSTLEDMTKELHAALVEYQNRILKFEALRQDVQANECDCESYAPIMADGTCEACKRPIDYSGLRL